MKKLLLSGLILCNAVLSLAQKNFTGTWQGSLNVGKELRLVFHITDEDGGKPSATMDSPDQGVTAIPAGEVVKTGDSISIRFSSFKAGYEGVLTDSGVIMGNWIQGRPFPLQLKKTDNPVRLNRPQTPQPPFPYQSEDLIYRNADGSIQYGATMTIPKGSGPFPALLLITGSGQENRDEEIFGHKPFAVIADYLTRRGYVVLRVDDRGVGKTTGDLTNATSADFAKDVNAGVDYLETRKEVNKQKIGLLGHSEGGMIAPMVAGQRKDIDFLVLMAAPGIKISELMADQNAAIMEQKGVSPAAIKAYKDLYLHMAIATAQAKDTAAYRASMRGAVKSWRLRTPDSLVALTTGIPGEISEDGFADIFVKELGSPWMKYFIGFDPQPDLRKLHAKVLALNGSKDMQVLADPNLEGIKASLGQSKSKNYEVKKIDGVNHLFQRCKSCSFQEYAQLEETMSTEVLQIIGDWLDTQVK